MSGEAPSPQEIVDAILTLVEEEAPKHTKLGERFGVTYGTVAQFSGLGSLWTWLTRRASGNLA